MFARKLYFDDLPTNTRDCATVHVCMDTVRTVKREILSQKFNVAREMQKNSSLLSLPLELRNQIYESVFQGLVVAIGPSIENKDRLDVEFWPATTEPYDIISSRCVENDRGAGGILALLYTCRQIYAETRFLSCRVNTVQFGDRPFPHTWLTKLPIQLAHVHSLRLCSYMPANIALSRVWTNLLPLFSGLKEVEIYWPPQMPPWGSEEDHLSTAALDESEMREKVVKVTSATCKVNFHRAVVGGNA